MKALFMLVVALTLFVEAVSAQLVTNLFIGSEEMVIRNGLVNAQYVSVGIQQQRTDGRYLTVSQGATPLLVFTNKAYLDSVTTNLINKVAQNVISNSVGQNKDGNFIVSVFVSRTYMTTMRTINFLGGRVGDFKLIRSGNDYKLPDFSNFVVGVPVNATYYLPQLSWARITTTDENGTRTVDSAVESNTMFDFGRHAIVLPRDVALSGQTKISVIYGPDNVYASFDENGALLAEDPPSTKMEVLFIQALATKGVISSTAIRLSFSGGDIGRSYEVESSADLKKWALVPDTRFTVFYRLPYAEHASFTIASEGENMFYRLRSVNRVPQYQK